MDIKIEPSRLFDSPYYRINKILLTVLGLWPDLSGSRKKVSLAIYTLVSLSLIIPIVSGFKNIWGVDLAAVIENCIGLLYFLAIYIKYISAYFFMDRLIHCFRESELLKMTIIIVLLLGVDVCALCSNWVVQQVIDSSEGVFQSAYFSANKKLLTFIGFRPYGSMSNYVVRTIFIVVTSLMMIPHGLSAIIHHENIDRMILNLVCFLTLSIVYIKLLTMSVSENNFEELYDSMTNNFLTIRDEEERKILVEYSETGRMLTFGYAITMFVSGTTISMLPLFPRLLDLIYPLEEPRTIIYVMEGEFFFDREDHPLAMFLLETATTAVVVAITVPADTIYMASAEHACALYAIISFRLKNLRPTMRNDSAMSDDDLYTHLSITIDLHQKALRFTSIMNDSYSKTFLFIMFVNIGIIPLDACAIIAKLHTGVGYLPYVLLFNAIVFHLFMVFYPGQRILDHGANLYSDACCNEWYALPNRTKKLLLIFMLRCTQPSFLTGGGLFLMGLETYARIMKTSVSYITVLASFRNQ